MRQNLLKIFHRKKILFCLPSFYFSLSAAPQAIVFDFGDVLTTKPNTEEIRQFLRTSFGLSKEEFIRANQLKYDLIKQGKTDDRQFWIEYAKDHNIVLPEGWLDEFIKIKTTVLVDPKTSHLTSNSEMSVFSRRIRRECRWILLQEHLKE